VKFKVPFKNRSGLNLIKFKRPKTKKHHPKDN